MLTGGVKWGLEKTEQLLSDAGDPHLAYPTIHIAGTNGKGSTAAMVSSVLKSSGLRVGLYTSPHLRHFSERIRVDGRPVDPDRLLDEAESLEDSMARLHPTFFESATVLAFQAFRSLEVDVAVVEVGLGGRLDSTNVIRPEASAITSIALDHADYLGDTLLEIAREKAGILKKDVPTVTAVSDPEVLAILREVADSVGAPLTAIKRARLQVLNVSMSGTEVHVDETPEPLHFELPLIGEHQAVNALLAIELLARLPDTLRPETSDVIHGLSSVFWPGRMQIARDGAFRWLFDIAHNPASVETLTTSLARLDLPRPRIAVVGVLGDKDWRTMLPPLVEYADQVLLTIPPSAAPERVWDPHDAARTLDAGPRVQVVPDFGDALDRARELADSGTVVVTGSSHTVGDALEALDLPV